MNYQITFKFGTDPKVVAVGVAGWWLELSDYYREMLAEIAREGIPIAKSASGSQIAAVSGSEEAEE